MHKKFIASFIAFNFIASIFFFGSISVFAGGGMTGGGGFDTGSGGSGGGSGKTSFQVLVPTAEMRTPLVEEKDLDSCLQGMLSAAGGILGGLMGGGGESGGGNTLGGLGSDSGGGMGCSWDSIAWMAAKALIEVEFQGMLNMAQTGYFGEQSWLDNPDKYYSSINTEVTSYFFGTDYQNSTIIDSLKNPIRDSILRRENTPFTQRVSEGIAFPGGDEGYQTYIHGGGCPTGDNRDCWMAAQSPNSDAFMILTNTEKEMKKRQSEALTHTTNEILAGSGFRDKKDGCIDVLEVPGHYLGCTSKTPGSTIESQINDYLNSSVDSLKSSDELDETLSAAVQSLYKVIYSWLNQGFLSDL